MNKIILGAIIVIVIALIGIYYMVTNTNKNMPQENQNNETQNSFDIQGMKVEILQQGSGTEAKANDYITVDYVGTLENGQKFDSSIDRGVPLQFYLGQGQVIKGWDLGVAGMKIGEKRRLTIPSELGYGATGYPPVIPPNATLIFEVTLLKVN